MTRKTIRSKLDDDDRATEDLWGPQHQSNFQKLIREYVGPIVLMLVCPIFVNVAALAGKHYHSNLVDAVVATTTANTPNTTFFVIPSFRVIKAITLFCLFELLLLVILPGRPFQGARAPSGYVPVFRENGGMACVLTLCVFKVLVDTNLIDAAFIYDELLAIQTCLNIAALIGSIALFVKGIYAPSTPDHGYARDSGLAIRLYWGEELYPSVYGVDLKHLVITRWGMMGWLVFTVSLMCASIRQHDGMLTPAMALSGGLNILYVLKFFIFFEKEYMKAADIAVDRLGYMLCWGTIGFMPLVHNLQTLFLVRNDGVQWLTWPLAICLGILGCLCIFLNYDSDTQRHHFRAAGGKYKIWGKPARFIRAMYVTSDGIMNESLLLCSGYQGIARHIHYLFDMIWLVLLALPCGFDVILPWTYCLYLTSLLLDRTYRIDARCEAKYGKFWKAYVTRVRWKLIPGVW